MVQEGQTLQRPETRRVEGAPPEPHLMVLMTLVSNFQFESRLELSSHPGLADK